MATAAEERAYSAAWQRLLKLTKDNLPLSEKLESFIVAVVHPGGMKPSEVTASTQMTELTDEQVRMLVSKLKGKPFTASHGVARNDNTKAFDEAPITIGAIEDAMIDEEGRMLALIKIGSTPEGILTSSKIAKDVCTDVSIMYYSRVYLDEGKMGIDLEHVASTDKGYLRDTHILGYFPKDDPNGYRIFHADSGLITKSALIKLFLPAVAQSGCISALKDIYEISTKEKPVPEEEATPTADEAQAAEDKMVTEPEPVAAEAEPQPEPVAAEPVSEAQPAAAGEDAPKPDVLALHTLLLQRIDELKTEVSALRSARTAPTAGDGSMDVAAPETPTMPAPNIENASEKTKQSLAVTETQTSTEVSASNSAPPTLTAPSTRASPEPPSPLLSSISPGPQTITVQNSFSARTTNTPMASSASNPAMSGVPEPTQQGQSVLPPSSMDTGSAEQRSHDAYTDVPEIAVLAPEEIVERGATADRPTLYASAVALAEQIEVLRKENAAVKQQLTEFEKRHLESMEDAVRKVLEAGGDTDTAGVPEAIKELQKLDTTGRIREMFTKVVNSKLNPRMVTDEDVTMQLIQSRAKGQLKHTGASYTIPIQNSRNARLDAPKRFSIEYNNHSGSDSRSSSMGTDHHSAVDRRYSGITGRQSAFAARDPGLDFSS